MKEAGIYRLRTKLLLHPISETITGVGIATPPFIVLSGEISPAVLGKAVTQVLDSSQTGVPQPADPSSVTRAILEAAGAKSWSALAKGAVYCGIDLDGAFLQFKPTKNKGARGGFLYLPATFMNIPADVSLEEIGMAAQKALTLSEGA